ncbi:MAG: PaaI family thioesterase [Deltaproteobacteria bacterium]|nr:PaaI family thioesterase [Deltaproteobacteria bacterium]
MPQTSADRKSKTMKLKDIINGTSPFAEKLGIEVSQFDPGAAQCELAIKKYMLNKHASVHGGVIYSLADVAMGVALYARLNRPKQQCATIEIKMNYLRPALGDRLVCKARVLQQGKSIAVVEAEIEDRDTLIAKALGTFAVLPVRAPEEGQGGPTFI